MLFGKKLKQKISVKEALKRIKNIEKEFLAEIAKIKKQRDKKIAEIFTKAEKRKLAEIRARLKQKS